MKANSSLHNMATTHPRLLSWFASKNPLAVLLKLLPIIGLYIYALIKAPVEVIPFVSLAAAGVIFWSFFEYAVHRWVYHIRFRGKALRWFFDAFHFHHHSDMTDHRVLNAGILLIYPLTALVLLPVFLITWDIGLTSAFGVGASAYYFFYEMVHYFIHYKVYDKGYMRFIQRYHLFHHYRRWNVNFGNTSSFWDRLLGTYDSRFREFELSEEEEKHLITEVKG